MEFIEENKDIVVIICTFVATFLAVIISWPFLKKKIAEYKVDPTVNYPIKPIFELTDDEIIVVVGFDKRGDAIFCYQKYPRIYYILWESEYRDLGIGEKYKVHKNHRNGEIRLVRLSSVVPSEDVVF